MERRKEKCSLVLRTLYEIPQGPTGQSKGAGSCWIQSVNYIKMKKSGRAWRNIEKSITPAVQPAFLRVKDILLRFILSIVLFKINIITVSILPCAEVGIPSYSCEFTRSRKIARLYAGTRGIHATSKIRVAFWEQVMSRVAFWEQMMNW